MSKISLNRLHDRRVCVALKTDASSHRVRGIGSYEQDQELGAVLRVEVGEGSEAFTLILDESSWEGVITPSSSRLADYEITLATAAQRRHSPVAQLT
jgi:hypothetical protein